MIEKLNIKEWEQHLLSDAFNHSPVGTALIDLDGTFIKANKALCDLIGYSEEEMKSFHFADITYEEDLFNDLGHFKKLNAGEIETYQIEKRYIHKQGHIVWGLLTVSRALDKKGEHSYTISQIVDITKSKQRDEEMKYLKSFYDHSKEGIGIFDLSGKTIKVNKAFEEIFGYKENEIVGQVLPATPEFTKKDAEYLLNQAQKGNLLKDFETIKQKKDGSYISVSITISPIHNDNGQLVAVAGVVRDITKQKATISQLKSFFNNNLDPIVIFNSKTQLIKVNKAFENLFGWKETELKGLNLGEVPIIPASKRQEVNKVLEKVLTETGINNFETIRLKKDGTIVDVQITSFLIQDENSVDSGYAIVFRDITARKRVAEKSLQNEKLSIAGQLSAGIVHEIRNPVTSIKGFMQLLKRNNQDKDYIEVMESELARVESILNEFLVLARPHEAKFQLHDISALLTQVITLMKVEANKHDIEVLENFQETEPLSCDPNQLKQVFINFIKNAIEAMPNGGTLEIIQTLQKAENQMVIQFNDNGCGMSEKVLKNWANPFNTTKETGTGLGVMISKNIIENHKGRLTVESEENKGTKITVYLPFNR